MFNFNLKMSGDQLSRPNSLLLESPPEKEPLKFNVQLVGAPPEVEQLVNNIKQVAEDFLYHWKTFPIVLPPSRFAGNGCKLSDIIIPPCDELDPHIDAGVDPQPLTPKQLHSIKETGKFEVPSRLVPGQSQVWVVNPWLLRGREHAHETLLTNVGRACALIVIVARDRILRDEPLSVLAGVKSVMHGLHRLLDVFIGMPAMEARDLDKKIREERARYLVAELICKPEYQEDISALASWVSRVIRRAAIEKLDPREIQRTAPHVPCVYTTPQKIQVDLRLHRRELLRRATPLVQAILERESRGWFLQHSERLAAQLADQKVPLPEIEEEVRVSSMREYIRRVCAAIRKSVDLAPLGDSVRELLAEQMEASLIIHRAEEGVNKRLCNAVSCAMARTKSQHPVLGRAPLWAQETRELLHDRFTREFRWTAYEEAAASLKSHGLHQHRYFLMRDLVFKRDREPLLKKELERAMSPCRSFSFSAVRWSRARAVTRVRATADTRYPAWRTFNTAYRAWTWSWNMLFLFGVIIPWYSPLSIRALVRVSPFTTDYDITKISSCLVPTRSKEVQTIWSRLSNIWRHVSKQRTKFSDTDTGAASVGSGWWWWCACARSAALLVLGPPLVLASVLLSVVAALSAPLWAPAAALLLHATNILVYDVDSPRKSYNRWSVVLEALIWRIVLLGAVQAVAAGVVAVLLCPLCALLIIAGSGVTWRAVTWWERSVCWWIAGRARASWCRPAPAPPPLLAITSGQAAACVVAKAEAEALRAWAGRVKTAMYAPVRDYRHFVDACFGPFSVQIANCGAYKQVERECAELSSSLQEKVEARERDLTIPLTDVQRARVRMSTDDIRRAIQMSGEELPRVWGAVSDEQWWAERGLQPDEWHELAANMLVEVFSGEVVRGVEEGAACVRVGGGEGWAPPPDLLPAHSAHAHIGRWCWTGRAPAVEAGWWSPHKPPLPPPALVPLLLYNRDADNPLPLESELCAEILKILEDAPDSDERRGVERYRGGASSTSSGTSDTADEDHIDDDHDHCRSGGRERAHQSAPLLRDRPVSPSPERAVCHWTLTGRGVRLKADLASPEDVSLDIERAHIGTSV